MEYCVCVVRDSAANVYGVPMFMGSRGQAIRSFSDEVQRADANNMLYKHPEDFELFYVGRYFDSDARFDMVTQPVSLIRGADCIKS